MIALPYMLLSGGFMLLLLGLRLAWQSERGLLGVLTRWEDEHSPMALAAFAAAIWNVAYAAELFAEGEFASESFHRFTYLGVVVVPPAILASVRMALRHERNLPVWEGLALLPVPAISLVLLASAHPLYWQADGLLTASGLSVINGIRGPWFWINAGFAWLCIAIAAGVFLLAHRASAKVRRGETLSIVGALMAPALPNSVALMAPAAATFDFTPLCIVASVFMLARALEAKPLRSLLPVAHALILDELNDGVVVVDDELRIASSNRAALAVLGLPRDTPAQGMLLADLWPELGDMVRGASRESGIVTTRDADGDIRHFDARVSPVGSEGKLIAVALRDVTERIAAEVALQHLANHDELTGLSNRARFHRSLARAVSQAEGDASPMALLLVDLDGFKAANDTLGHVAGDVLLHEIAAAMQGQIRNRDILERLERPPGDADLARLGGDEFALILPSIRHGDEAGFVAERLLNAIQTGSRQWKLGASIGIAIFPEDAQRPDLLVRNADAALYHAKSEGGRQVQFFHPTLNANAERRTKLERRLLAPEAWRNLSVMFQAKIAPREERLVGAEALLRWTDSELGLVSPEEFIPIAERTGVIVEIGKFVLQSVCRRIGEWRAAGLDVPPIAVNVSSRQLEGREFFEMLTDILRREGLPPEALEIEITERSLLRTEPDTIQVLRDLRAIGIRIWLDDFGKGYSSLSYLNSFQLDGLKLDRSFISHVDSDYIAQGIAAGIVTMARRLGLTIVAEGVENEAEVRTIMDLGAEQIQGYWYARPWTPEQMKERLRHFGSSAAGLGGKDED